MTARAAQTALFVVDASVVLKWFLVDDEDDTAKALKLRDLFIAGEVELTAPELILHETANVLRYKAGSDADLVARAIDSLWQMDLISQIGAEESRMAVTLAFDLVTTVYDALYLALAESLGAQLITADKKFCRQAASRGSRQLGEERSAGGSAPAFSLHARAAFTYY